jgi:hypothetical protein
MTVSTFSEEVERMLHIWVEVCDGRGEHGNFLMAFAQTFCWADYPNQMILFDASRSLIAKYGLDQYLDNFDLDITTGPKSCE